MKLKLTLLCVFVCIGTNAQVGVGTTTPEGALDLNPTVATNYGFAPPRVALTSTILQAPVVNPQGGVVPNGTLVWNTNTNSPTIATAVAPGMYYWNGTRWISVAGSPGGLDWSIIGNGGINGGTTGITGTPATSGTHFLGTYDPTNMDIRTNGLHAARVSSLGEFFIGGLETVLPGDLMNGIAEGNTSFPWAVNGYTDQNGAGVYGNITGGTTNYAAVQGEYHGTGARGAGVRGITQGTTDGTSITSFNAGVVGDLGDENNEWAFAIAGRTMSNNDVRVGGALGRNSNNGEYGILGYERSNGNNYAVLGSSAYSTSGLKTTSTHNSSIGLAINGGFLGGHLIGKQYGLITKGEVVGQYTDGSSVSNKGYAVVNTTKSGEKVATYVPTSTTVDVSTKGTGKLVNGTAIITFDRNYSNLTDKSKPVIVTVSPMGETKGVYVSEVTNNEFTVKENGNGKSNVSFYWIAIGEKNNAEEMNIPSELLAKDFDENLDSFLTIDEEAKEVSKAMWWNGTSLEFGKTAPKETHEGTNKTESDERKGERTPKKENLRASQIRETKTK